MTDRFQVLLSSSTCAATQRAGGVDRARRVLPPRAHGQGLTSLPISAHLELFCPPCNPLQSVTGARAKAWCLLIHAEASLSLSLSLSLHLSHECVLELVQLSSDVNECKPLLMGCQRWDGATATRFLREQEAAEGQGLTLVHFSAQPQPFWSMSRFVSGL
jgi:hypothetical protein